MSRPEGECSSPDPVQLQYSLLNRNPSHMRIKEVMGKTGEGLKQTGSFEQDKANLQACRHPLFS